MPRAFLQRSRPRLLTAAAWSGLRPAPESRSRGAHPHLPRSCTTPVYLLLPPFCVSLQLTEAAELRLINRPQDSPRRRLNDLVLQGGDAEGSLPAIWLRNISS